MKWKVKIGWAAVILTTIFSSFWGFWGIIENFHEGWYSESLWQNISLMFIQYIPWSFSFIVVGLLALSFPRIGALCFIITGLILPLFIGIHFGIILILSLPLIIIGLLYYWGRPEPKIWASRVVLYVPLIVILGFGIEPVSRLSGRVDDGNYGARIIEGNGLRLVWAPEGPGWPNDMKQYKVGNWDDIKNICSRLNEDGITLSDTIRNIWRLPTAEEAVRSLVRHGKNAGGILNTLTMDAKYETMPDKESPLWKIHSPIIYWWTSSEKDNNHAYRITYNGYLNPLFKKLRMGDLSFRAVREVK
jgi:hypothetical protein